MARAWPVIPTAFILFLLLLPYAAAINSYDVISVNVLPSGLTVVITSPLPPPPAIVTISETTNTSVGTSPIPIAPAVNYTIVTVNITPLLAVTLIVPSEVTTCYPTVSLTIYAVSSSGGPVAQLNITYTSPELNITGFAVTDSSGRATISLSLPSYGTYHVYYYVNGTPAGSSTINYVRCVGPGFGGLQGVVSVGKQLNVSTLITPVSPSTLPTSIQIASRPSLTTPEGIVVAALIGAVWAWMSRKTGVSYATTVVGFVLMAIGAVSNTQAFLVAGALMLTGGIVLKVLRLTT